MRRWMYRLLFIFIAFCLQTEISFTQEEISLSGRLTVLYGDPPPDSSEEPQAYTLLEDAQGNIIAQVIATYGQVMDYYLDQVEVRGTLASDAFSQALHAPQVIVASSISRIEEGITSQLVSGSQPWVNLLCKFPDSNSEPRTPSQYQSMFSTTYPGLDHYWQQISESRVNLAGTVTLNQWVTLPRPRSYYVVNEDSPNLTQLILDCTAAADRLVNFAPFVGINVMLNMGIGCCAWGGSRFLTLDGQSKSYRTTWLPPWSQTYDVIAHEMGHGFGLPHSSGPADAPPTDLNVYVSQWDVMSDSNGTCAAWIPNYGCLAPGTIAYYLDRLGWMPEADRITIPNNTEQTFTLERLRLNLATNGLRYAHIPIGTSSTQFYTVEVRGLSGYDQNIPGQAVVIHFVDLAAPQRNNTGPALVVDADDGNNNVNDSGARWVAGETFYDSARNIEIAVLRQNGSYFTVRVRNNYTPATPTRTPTATATTVPAVNLLQNGSFSSLDSSGVPLHWTMYASPNKNLLQWQVVEGVLNFYRNPLPGERSEAVVFQNTNMAVDANSGLRAEFQMGNSSNVRKRVTVLVHEWNFSDLQVCSFWLPPNTPLRSYVIRTYTANAWTNASISFYASTADGLGSILLDNISLYRESEFVPRTLCDDPSFPALSSGEG
jgi:hypothetical protein